MFSTLIVGSALKIAASLGVGMGTCAMFTTFHNHEFKPKKKKELGGLGDEHGIKSLREKARQLG